MSKEELQVPYTLEVQGVIGIVESEWTRDKLEEHLGDTQNVSIIIEGVTMYHPDGVELTYLDFGEEEE